MTGLIELVYLLGESHFATADLISIENVHLCNFNFTTGILPSK